MGDDRSVLVPGGRLGGTKEGGPSSAAARTAEGRGRCPSQGSLWTTRVPGSPSRLRFAVPRGIYDLKRVLRGGMYIRVVCTCVRSFKTRVDFKDH